MKAVGASCVRRGRVAAGPKPANPLVPINRQPCYARLAASLTPLPFMSSNFMPLFVAYRQLPKLLPLSVSLESSVISQPQPLPAYALKESPRVKAFGYDWVQSGRERFSDEVAHARYHVVKL